MLDGRFLCQSPDVIVSEFCLDCLDQRMGFNAPATCALWCRWHVHLTYTHTHTHLSLRPFVKTRGHLELKRDQESTTRFNAQHRCNMTAWQLCLFVSTQKLLQTPVCSPSGKENQPKVIKRSKQIARSAKVEVERMRSNKFKSSCMCFQHLLSFWWCTCLRRNIGTEKVKAWVTWVVQGYSCQLGQGQCTMGTKHVSPCPIVLLVLTEETLGQTSAQYLI